MSTGFGPIYEEIPLGRGWYLMLEDSQVMLPGPRHQPSLAHCCRANIRRRVGGFQSPPNLQWCLACKKVMPKQVMARAEFWKGVKGWKSWRE